MSDDNYSVTLDWTMPRSREIFDNFMDMGFVLIEIIKHSDECVRTYLVVDIN